MEEQEERYKGMTTAYHSQYWAHAPTLRGATSSDASGKNHLPVPVEAGMNTNAPANLKQLSTLLRPGGGPALKFKLSTGDLKKGMQTLCVFLNDTGGQALFGVRPAGTIQRIGTTSGLSQGQVEVLRLYRQEQPLVAMMNVVGRQSRTKFRDGLVKSLIEAGLLELTILDKLPSSKQRYRLTEKGRQAMRKG
jgi:hypothetical protein